MTATKQRLQKLETSLTPKQAVLHWLEEAHRFRSAADYVRWLHPQGDGAYPLMRLPKQVEEATRRAMTGAPREGVARAVRTAVRDVFFLFFLHHEANARLMAERRAHALLVAFLASEYPGREDRRKGTDLDPAALRTWRERAEPVVVELYGYREALAIISIRYLDGQDLLFREVREDLDVFIAGMETLVALHNEEVEVAGPGRKQRRRSSTSESIDQERLLALARREAVGEAARLVDAAKLQVLRIMGEHGEGNALLDRQDQSPAADQPDLLRQHGRTIDNAAFR